MEYKYKIFSLPDEFPLDNWLNDLTAQGWEPMFAVNVRSRPAIMFRAPRPGG